MFNIDFMGGWSYVTSIKSIPLSSHEFVEIVYFVTGKATVKIAENSYEAYPGTLFIIDKNIIHEEIRYAPNIKSLCIRLNTDFKFKKDFYTDHTGEFLSVITSIIEEYTLKHHNYKELIDLKMKELFYLLDREDNFEKTATDDFKYAINFISENCTEKINFRQLASNLNISYDHFHHKFKDITGHSPQSYLINKRLEETAKILKYSPLNCTEIAYNYGFSNSAQFSMLFKRKYGVSPLQYRKSNNVVEK